MSFKNYGKLCTEVYDVTKPVGHFWGMEYFQDRLKDCKGRILEAMVGSGRVLIPLVKLGLQIDGVDSSQEMLDSCEKRLKEHGLNANIYNGTLEELELPHRYEAIFIAGASFLLIEDRATSIKTLQRLHDHLEPNGRLLIDIELPSTDFELGKVSTGTIPLPNGDTITIESKLVEVDMLHQYTVTYLKYEKWKDGQLIDTELQRFPLRCYGIDEFKLILQSIGFRNITVTAEYTPGKPLTKHTKVFTVEAIKV